MITTKTGVGISVATIRGMQRTAKRWIFALAGMGSVLIAVTVSGVAMAAQNPTVSVSPQTIVNTYDFSAYVPWTSIYPWTSVTRTTQSVEPDEYTSSISPSSMNGAPMVHMVYGNNGYVSNSQYANVGEFLTWTLGNGAGAGQPINMIIGGNPLTTLTNFTVDGFWAP